MYCNEKIIQYIELDGYIKDMPKWTYDISNGELHDDSATLEDVGFVCSSLEIEENLQPNGTFDRATKRTPNHMES